MSISNPKKLEMKTKIIIIITIYTFTSKLQIFNKFMHYYVINSVAYPTAKTYPPITLPISRMSSFVFYRYTYIANLRRLVCSRRRRRLWLDVVGRHHHHLCCLGFSRVYLFVGGVNQTLNSRDDYMRNSKEIKNEMICCDAKTQQNAINDIFIILYLKTYSYKKKTNS